MRDITNLFRDLSRTIVTKNILHYRMIRKIYILNKFVMRTMNRYLYFLTNFFFYTIIIFLFTFLYLTIYIKSLSTIIQHFVYILPDMRRANYNAVKISILSLIIIVFNLYIMQRSLLREVRVISKHFAVALSTYRLYNR